MMFDLSSELRRAAGPLPELDAATFARISRPRRRTGRATVLAAVVALVAGLTGRAVLVDDGPTVRLAAGGDTAGAANGVPAAGGEPATATASAASERAAPTDAGGQPETSAGINNAEWQVMTVAATAVSSLAGHVAVDQHAFDRLWQGFNPGAPPPVLPAEHGALLQPVAGSCDDPAQVTAVRVVRAADATASFATVEFDPGCADFLHNGSYEPPPRTLYAVAVPSEFARSVAGVVGVAGTVGALDWDVMAVATTPDASHVDTVVMDQTGVDQMWRTFQVQTAAPALPTGRGALIVTVSGGCDSAAQVLGVALMVNTDGNPGNPSVSGYVAFDPGCARQQRYEGFGPWPATLYAISVPLEVAKAIDGAIGLIACDQARADCAAHPVSAARANLAPS